MYFATDRRKPLWTYSTRGVLWQLQVGALDFLVGEDRILDVKEASFFCLDRKTGLPRWEGLVPGDRWWSGIEAVAGGLVLFHGFASPDMPFHRGLTAVDLASGRTLWSLMQERFLRMERNAVLVAKEGPEGVMVVRVDPASGAVMMEGEEGNRPFAGAGGHGPVTLLPQPLREATIEDAGLREAIRAALPATAERESTLALQWDDYCVLAYSERTPGGGGEDSFFRTSLVVLGGAPWAPLFSDVAERGSRAVIQEPFFCQEGMLYFVKDRSMLVAVSLRTP